MKPEKLRLIEECLMLVALALILWLALAFISGCGTSFSAADRAALINARVDASVARGDIAVMKDAMAAFIANVTATVGGIVTQLDLNVMATNRIEQRVSAGRDTNSTAALIAAIVSPAVVVPICFITYWKYKRRVYAKENGHSK